jgi:hypothetical protein
MGPRPGQASRSYPHYLQPAFCQTLPDSAGRQIRSGQTRPGPAKQKQRQIGPQRKRDKGKKQQQKAEAKRPKKKQKARTRSRGRGKQQSSKAANKQGVSTVQSVSPSVHSKKRQDPMLPQLPRLSACLASMHRSTEAFGQGLSQIRSMPINPQF